MRWYKDIPWCKVGYNIHLCSSVPQHPYSIKDTSFFWGWKACRRQHGSTMQPSNWVLFDQCTLSRLCNGAVQCVPLIDLLAYTLPVLTAWGKGKSGFGGQQGSKSARSCHAYGCWIHNSSVELGQFWTWLHHQLELYRAHTPHAHCAICRFTLHTSTNWKHQRLLIIIVD